MRARTFSRQRGISLTEVAVALGIVAGVVHLGAPPLAEMLRGSRLTGAMQELLADVYLARMEALQRNRRVTLCKSPDGLRCVTPGGWEQGWLMFQDENGNGALDPGEERIARRAGLQPMLRLRGNAPVANYISYTPLGASKLASGAFQAGTLTACERSQVRTASRQVVLNSVGRPRIQRATVASCS